MPLPPGPPRWKRRKEARPAEIIQAAYDVFAERGFASARLDDIAARANVSKGALYLYFETKQDLFEAVVREAVQPECVAVDQALLSHPGSFGEAFRDTVSMALESLAKPQTAGLLKLVIAETHNHPEITRIWYEQIMESTVNAVTQVIERAQASGEIRAGDARHLALCMLSPFMMNLIWSESFQSVGARPFDTALLADLHLDVMIAGLQTSSLPKKHLEAVSA